MLRFDFVDEGFDLGIFRQALQAGVRLKDGTVAGLNSGDEDRIAHDSHDFRVLQEGLDFA